MSHLSKGTNILVREHRILKLCQNVRTQLHDESRTEITSRQNPTHHLIAYLCSSQTLSNMPVLPLLWQTVRPWLSTHCFGHEQCWWSWSSPEGSLPHTCNSQNPPAWLCWSGPWSSSCGRHKQLTQGNQNDMEAQQVSGDRGRQHNRGRRTYCSLATKTGSRHTNQIRAG